MLASESVAEKENFVKTMGRHVENLSTDNGQAIKWLINNVKQMNENQKFDLIGLCEALMPEKRKNNRKNTLVRGWIYLFQWLLIEDELDATYLEKAKETFLSASDHEGQFADEKNAIRELKQDLIINGVKESVPEFELPLPSWLIEAYADLINSSHQETRSHRHSWSNPEQYAISLNPLIKNGTVIPESNLFPSALFNHTNFNLLIDRINGKTLSEEVEKQILNKSEEDLADVLQLRRLIELQLCIYKQKEDEENIKRLTEFAEIYESLPIEQGNDPLNVASSSWPNAHLSIDEEGYITILDGDQNERSAPFSQRVISVNTAFQELGTEKIRSYNDQIEMIFSVITSNKEFKITENLISEMNEILKLNAKNDVVIDILIELAKEVFRLVAISNEQFESFNLCQKQIEILKNMSSIKECVLSRSDQITEILSLITDLYKLRSNKPKESNEKEKRYDQENDFEEREEINYLENYGLEGPLPSPYQSDSDGEGLPELELIEMKPIYSKKQERVREKHGQESDSDEEVLFLNGEEDVAKEKLKPASKTNNEDPYLIALNQLSLVFKATENEQRSNLIRDIINEIDSLNEKNEDSDLTKALTEILNHLVSWLDSKNNDSYLQCIAKLKLLNFSVPFNKISCKWAEESPIKIILKSIRQLHDLLNPKATQNVTVQCP